MKSTFLFSMILGFATTAHALPGDFLSSYHNTPGLNLSNGYGFLSGGYEKMKSVELSKDGKKCELITSNSPLSAAARKAYRQYHETSRKELPLSRCTAAIIANAINQELVPKCSESSVANDPAFAGKYCWLKPNSVSRDGVYVESTAAENSKWLSEYPEPLKNRAIEIQNEILAQFKK